MNGHGHTDRSLHRKLNLDTGGSHRGQYWPPASQEWERETPALQQNDS